MNTLIVRGDLRTHTGYSKALRSIVALLADDFDRVFGVDLHYSPSKSVVEFPYWIIPDHQISSLGGKPEDTTTVLHFTTPDGFVGFPDAYNIGYFFWETDRFRRDLFWPEQIDTMDEIWAPNRFMADLIAAQGYSKPIRVIAWPHDFSTSVDASVWAAGSLEVVDQPSSYEAGRPGSNARSLAWVREHYQTLFLAIMTDAPRKGLAILLSQWCQYLAQRQTRSALLIKLGSIDVTKTSERLTDDVNEILSLFWRPALGSLDLGLICRSVSEADLSALYAQADGFVSATLGEGFGGTITECVLNRTAYISPRHTSLAELIPPTYPFIVATEEASVVLRNNIPVYSPSSKWHVPVRGSICEAMLRFEELDRANRDRLLDETRAYAAQLCDIKHVRRGLSEACALVLDAARSGRSVGATTPPVFAEG